MKKQLPFLKAVALAVLSIVFIGKINAQIVAGTYTIGGTTPDYLTVKAAVDTMVNYGIAGDGHIIFNIRDGVYNEQVSIAEIANTDENNTITFQSEINDPDDVRIEFDGTTSSSINYVIEFAGCDYVTFQYITQCRLVNKMS